LECRSLLWQGEGTKKPSRGGLDKWSYLKFNLLIAEDELLKISIEPKLFLSPENIFFSSGMVISLIDLF
jgi:hypothetical protein